MLLYRWTDPGSGRHEPAGPVLVKLGRWSVDLCDLVQGNWQTGTSGRFLVIVSEPVNGSIVGLGCSRTIAEHDADHGDCCCNGQHLAMPTLGQINSGGQWSHCPPVVPDARLFDFCFHMNMFDQ